MPEPFCLSMWTDAAPKNKIVEMIDGEFRNETINALIDYLHVTKLSEKENRIVERIFDWRSKHLRYLEEEIRMNRMTEDPMILWLQAYDGEDKKWNPIIYKNYEVIDPATEEKGRNMVNLDAKLSGYIFHDEVAKCDGLVIEASYIPVV